MENFNLDLFRSRIDVFVLKILSEQDRYGYEILEILFKDSISHYEIKQSTLYNLLNRLETDNLVFSYEGTESNGAKRKYYSLTPTGKEKIDREKLEWEFIRSLLDRLISNQSLDLSAISPPVETRNIKPLTSRKRSNENDEIIEAQEEVLTDLNEKEYAKTQEEVLTDLNEKEDAEAQEEVLTDLNEKEDVEAQEEVLSELNENESAKTQEEVLPELNKEEGTEVLNNSNEARVVEYKNKESESRKSRTFENHPLFAPLPNEKQNQYNYDTPITNDDFPSLSDFGKMKKETSINNSRENYKDVLSEMYKTPAPSEIDIFQDENESCLTNSVHYNDLILTLRNENIIVKKYTQTSGLKKEKKRKKWFN